MNYSSPLQMLTTYYSLARCRINRIIKVNNLNFDETWTLIHEELDFYYLPEKFDTQNYENEAIKELAGVYGLSVCAINGYIEDSNLDKESVWEQVQIAFEKTSIQVQ